MRFLILSLLLTSCAAATTFGRRTSSTGLPWGLSQSDIPSANALVRWSDPQYEDPHLPALDSLAHVEVPASCPDRHLYPSHPQQSTKTYHVFRVAVYDQAEVEAGSRLCRVRTHQAQPRCLMSDVFEYAVLSDLFRDACGGLYRGVWNVKALKQDDSMGTLFSKGRVMEPKPNSPFEGDMDEGPTYAVDRSDFLFLAPPFPGDAEQVATLAAQAAPLELNPSTHLFAKKP